MKVKYIDGELSIYLVDIIHEMTDEEQLLLVESLSCQSSIIEFVGQQITKGYTENGFYGGRYWGSPDASTALDKIIREIANKSGEIAEKEIKRLCDLVNFHEKQTKKEHEKLFALEKKYNDLLDKCR